MAHRVKFWDKISAKYAARPIDDPVAYEQKLAITQSYLTPEMCLMEFGCGTGGTALYHAPKVKNVTAIDFSEKMLDFAKIKLAESGLNNVSFEKSSLDEFDAPDNSFDMILGLSVLHLLEDKDAAIQKVHDLLKPGGLFVSSTTCIDDAAPWLKFVAPPLRLIGLIPALSHFSKSELKQSIIQAGFDIEEAFQPAPKQAIFLVARKTG